MEAERVIEKILSDVQAETEKLAAESRQKLSIEEAKEKQKFAAYQIETQRLVKEAAEDTKSRLLATARMEMSMEILRTKRELIDEVFAAAVKKIESLPDAEYQGLMGVLLKKAVESGDEEVIIGQNERRLNHDFIVRVNSELGGKGRLRLSNERGDFSGGFMLKRGNIKVNASLETLLKQAYEALEIEIGKVLFE